MIDRSGRARLTDFGLTFIIHGENSIVSPQASTSPTSPTAWAAPEVLGGGPVSKEGDIFTFAMLAVEVCARISDENFTTQASSNRYLRGIPRSLATTTPLCLPYSLGNTPNDQRHCTTKGYGRSWKNAGVKNRQGGQPLPSCSGSSSGREFPRSYTRQLIPIMRFLDFRGNEKHPMYNRFPARRQPGPW